MKVKLPDSVSSSQDLTTLLLEVRDYARWHAHESIKKRVNAKSSADAPQLSSAAHELIHEWQAKKDITAASLDMLIKTLEEYKKTAPTLTMTLAAPPTNEVKRSLVGWCRENLAPNILVSFQFNTTLLGGMVVRSGSRVFDWSFRRQILASRHTFPEILRRV